MGKENETDLKLLNKNLEVTFTMLVEVMTALEAITHRLDGIEQILMNHKEHLEKLERTVYKKTDIDFKEYIQ
jgi:hypothetical protein